MRTIWKYEVPILGCFSLELPAGAELLTVQVQFGVPCIWVIVDPEKPLIEMQFRLFGTGHEINPKMGELTHVGSFMMLDGMLVWHLFVKKEETSHG
jgi:hypothetical protein